MAKKGLKNGWISWLRIYWYQIQERNEQKVCHKIGHVSWRGGGGRQGLSSKSVLKWYIFFANLPLSLKGWHGPHLKAEILRNGNSPVTFTCTLQHGNAKPMMVAASSSAAQKYDLVQLILHLHFNPPWKSINSVQSAWHTFHFIYLEILTWPVLPLWPPGARLKSAVKGGKDRKGFILTVFLQFPPKTFAKIL